MLIRYLAGLNNELTTRIARTGDGLHTFTPCEECNERTGYLYVPDYAQFIKTIDSHFLYDPSGKRAVYLRSIHPARVVKQIFCMFLCALPYEPPPAMDDLRAFVYEKDARLPPNAPDVYLYWNASQRGRLIPLQMLTHLWQTYNKFVQLSEISWPPLGIVLSYNEDDRLEGMEKITSWCRFLYDDVADIGITLPGKTIADPSPLAFGDPWKAERDKDARGTVAFLHVGDENPTLSMGLTWEPLKKR
jgi:hypothetical protein